MRVCHPSPQQHPTQPAASLGLEHHAGCGHAVTRFDLGRNFDRLHNRRGDPRTVGCRNVVLHIIALERNRSTGRAVDCF
jgi:hypothetical protein